MPYGQPGSIPGAPYGGFTGNYIDGLTKVCYMLDYMGNGLFPCKSPIVKSFLSKKKPWDFPDRFTYTTRFAYGNTGGTNVGQLYQQHGGVYRPGQREYGIFRASYGTITDALYVDMLANLETATDKVAFNSHYSEEVRDLRNSMGSIYKSVALNGSYIPVLEVETKNNIRTKDANGNFTVPHVMPYSPPIAAGGSWADLEAVAFEIDVGPDVFASNFQRGRTLGKTESQLGLGPWGPGYANYVVMILENISSIPGKLRLAVMNGSRAAVNWKPLDFLILCDNRDIAGFTGPQVIGGFEQPGIVNAAMPTNSMYTAYDATAGTQATTGAFEGLADLLPWFSDAAGNRLGLDLPFREQANRLKYTAQQAGNYVYQTANMTIMDAIMTGITVSQNTIGSLEGLGVWWNPMVRQCIEYEEGESMGIRATRQLASSSPVVYQKGVTSTSWHIGSKTINDTIDDPSLRTDVVIIAPEQQMFYNCWDNAFAQIDQWVQSGDFKLAQKDNNRITVPTEIANSIDFKHRIMWGQPEMVNNSIATMGRFTHPKLMTPGHFFEMGALFTEFPHYYTVVKLRETHFHPMDVTMP